MAKKTRKAEGERSTFPQEAKNPWLIFEHESNCDGTRTVVIANRLAAISAVVLIVVILALIRPLILG